MKQKQFLQFVFMIMFGLSAIHAQEVHTQANAISDPNGNEAGTVTGWTNPNGINVTADTTDPYSGDYCMKLEATAEGWRRSRYNFNVEVGRDYIITLYAKSDGTTLTDQGFYLWEGFSNFTPQDIVGTQWTKYTFNLTADATDAIIRVYTGSEAVPGNTVYIDNLSIRPVQTGDTQAPTAPTVSHAGQTHNTVNLSWPNASDNVGVTGYRVFKNGVLEADFGPFTSYQVTGLNPQNYYEFTVKAVDAAGNESEASNIIAVTTDDPPSTTDTEAPTAPTLSSSNQTDTSIDLSWTGATDNTAVTGYKVYNGLNVEATLGNVSSYQVTGLNTETNYTFTVRALDAAGNESPNSNTVNVSASTATVGGAIGNWLRDGDNISYSEGNVGIGTTDPKEKLHIEGNLLLDAYGAGTANGIFFREDFSATNKYNLSILTYDDGDGFPDAMDINAYDGIYFNTGFNGRRPRMFVHRDGNVGIGTIDPAAKLHIQGDGVVATRFSMANINDRVNDSPWYGMGWSDFLQLSNEVDRQAIQVAGYYGLLFRTSQGVFGMHQNGNIGIGTTNPDSKLTVKGKIHAEEVKIDLAVPAPDYVFDEDYGLWSLEDLQEYIKKHHHLPNIPSAKEMEAKGVELGVMNMKLLEKIEELTLYTLQQQNMLQIQQQQNQQLMERLGKLEQWVLKNERTKQ